MLDHSSLTEVINNVTTIFSDKTAIYTSPSGYSVHGVWEKDGKNRIRVKFHGYSHEPDFPVPTFITVTSLTTTHKGGATSSGTVHVEFTYEGAPLVVLDCEIESTRMTL